VSEVISAGFFYEPQLQIVNNLRKSLKPKGHIIPLSMENTVELIDAQSMLYGLRFDYDSRYRTLAEDHSLTKPDHLSVDQLPPGVESENQHRRHGSRDLARYRQRGTDRLQH
jgi:hypothetical protein